MTLGEEENIFFEMICLILFTSGNLVITTLITQSPLARIFWTAVPYIFDLN